MRRKLATIVVAVMVLGLLSGTALAELPGGGWVTNVQVQNVGANPADISITSYGAGGPYNSPVKNAAVGASVTFLNTELGVPSGFQGAGVMSSTESVFAILFATNYQAGTANTASAIVRGIGQDNVANTLSFPLVKKKWGSGQKTTTFYIQNAGSAATEATVTLSILAGGAGGCSNNPRTYTIQPSEQINFNPQDLGCPNSTLGSLMVASNGQPLAGIVLEHDDDMAAPAGGTRVLQGTSGFAPADYDTMLIAPIIKKGWGANKNVTGLQVQNVGTAPIPAGDLVVTYAVIGGPDAGTTKMETNTSAIAVGAAFNSLHGVLQNGSLASAVVSVNAGEKIVGIVNENRPAGTTVFRNTTYSMLPVHAAATNVSLPLVKEYYGGQGGRCTGVQVVAVGTPAGTPAVMQLTYKATTGATFTVTTNAAELSKTFLRISDGATPGVTVTGGAAADMRGKNFGVTATSLTAGVKLVAVANESFCPGATRDEDDANYEGFPLP
jgi:hypothetical protein